MRETPALVALLRSGEERDSLCEALSRAEWEVCFARTVREALAVLRERPAGVLLSESQLSDGCSWKDLLDQCQGLDCPPMLIVTDRLADDRLWAEVLNLGGYDLLLKPLEPTEVRRVVSSAWLRWKQEWAYRGRKPPGFVAETGLPAAGGGTVPC